jgi:hypothetical protein
MDAFVFIWYSKYSSPCVIIADLNEVRLDTVAQEQIDHMMRYGELVQMISQNVFGSNRYMTLGYRPVNGEFIIDDHIYDIWINIAENLETYQDDTYPQWLLHARLYKLSDEDKKLLPMQLRGKFKNSTYFQNCRCVLVCQSLINAKTKPLQFKFESDGIPHANMVSIITNKYHANKIFFTENNYGYISPLSMIQWQILNGKSQTIDGVYVMFGTS